MKSETNLSNQQLEALFAEAFEVQPVMSEEYGEEITFTRDSLAEFLAASKNYNECNRPVTGEVNGLQTLMLPRAQVRKGDQRRDVYLIDFGTVRGCFMSIS